MTITYTKVINVLIFFFFNVTYDCSLWVNCMIVVGSIVDLWKRGHYAGSHASVVLKMLSTKVWYVAIYGYLPDGALKVFVNMGQTEYWSSTTDTGILSGGRQLCESLQLRRFTLFPGIVMFISCI